jgi:hypothetical protein
MNPEDHTAAIHALQTDVSEIKAILNNGIRTMVNDQKSELTTVKDDIQWIQGCADQPCREGNRRLRNLQAGDEHRYDDNRRANRALALDHRLPARQSGRACTDQAHILRPQRFQMPAIKGLCNVVSEQLTKSISSLLLGDRRLAEAVIERDVTADALASRAHAEVVRIIARYQAVACDLREIVAAERLASNLERIGDHAKNIAKRCIALGQKPSGVVSELLSRFGDGVRGSVSRRCWRRMSAATLPLRRRCGARTKHSMSNRMICSTACFRACRTARSP